jgi:hypothetical protein
MLQLTPFLRAIEVRLKEDVGILELILNPELTPNPTSAINDKN